MNPFLFLGGFLLFCLREIGQYNAMAQNTQLCDLYTFPGCTPHSHIRGLFGDPYAAVITLRRRSKKAPVEGAAKFSARSTIKRSVWSVTSRPVGDASTFRFRFAASTAEHVTP
jgi:hypothetical protein